MWQPLLCRASRWPSTNASTNSETSDGTAPPWRALASCHTTTRSSTGVRVWGELLLVQKGPGGYGKTELVCGERMSCAKMQDVFRFQLFIISHLLQCVFPSPRFPRECLLPGLVGSGCGSLCGLGLQHGQAAGVWLWGQATPGWWQDPAEAHTAATADPAEGWGRHQHDTVITPRAKRSPWRPARQPTLNPPIRAAQAFPRWAEFHAGDMGLGGLQSWHPFWGSFLQGLARLPRVSKRHPRSHEDT